MAVPAAGRPGAARATGGPWSPWRRWWPRPSFSSIGIALHLAAVFVAFISLLTGVTGGWYAVSRAWRGAGDRRGTVVVVSVAAFGTGLYFADISVRQVILITALGGVSVLAAQYALSGRAGNCAPKRRTSLGSDTRPIPF